MKDSLGDRIKGHYEARAQSYLPRRTYTLIRLDGKAFHTYTRGCERPYDQGLMDDMDATAKALCEQIQGAKLAYVQSDEITLVLTDFEKRDTDAWFDGNVQKMTSISASMATAEFNRLRFRRKFEYQGTFAWDSGHAYFDSRVFTIPEREEVFNCLIWRQQDAVRNSIQMAAQARFSPKELHQKSGKELQEMLFQQHEVNWNDYSVGCKRGRTVVPRMVEKPVRYWDKRTEQWVETAPVQRREWQIEEPPIFTQDRDYLRQFIPARD